MSGCADWYRSEGHRIVSDTEQENARASRPSHRFRRLIRLTALFCVLAVYVVLTLRGDRPRWYTFVSKPMSAVADVPGGLTLQGPPTFALSVQVPIGWEC